LLQQEEEEEVKLVMITLNKQSFNCLTDYALEKINCFNPNKFKQFFNNLPVDPYLKGNYRFRRLSNFEVSASNLTVLTHSRLLQSKVYNPILGDVVREYQELERELIQIQDFQNLVFDFFELSQLCSTANEVAVHQIRTTSSHLQIGNPAPEGIHRDGVDLVAIFCIDRENIEGGTTYLYKQKESSPVFQKILNPGEFLVFDDRQFLHFTSPINVTNHERGTRDVFVMTCPGLVA
jgi:hypothetical protein